MADVLHGAGVGRGAVVGPVARAHPAPHVPHDEPAPADPGAAKERVREAFTAVADALDARAGAATGTIREVLSATALMARDPELAGQAAARIDQGVAPALAVDRATAEFVDLFTAAGGYLAERVTDLRSVRDRVVARLQGLPEPGVPALAVPSVVVADDLSPADTAALELDKVLGIVIELGRAHRAHGDHRGPARHPVRRAGGGRLGARGRAGGRRRRRRRHRRAGARRRDEGAGRRTPRGPRGARRGPVRGPHGRRARDSAARQHRHRRGRGAPDRGRRRGRRPVPHRGPVPRPHDRADGGRPGRRLRARARGHGRPQGRHPDPRRGGPTSRWPSSRARARRTRPSASGASASSARPRTSCARSSRR